MCVEDMTRANVKIKQKNNAFDVYYPRAIVCCFYVFVCNQCILCVCIPSYATRMLVIGARMLLVCIRKLLVCTSMYLCIRMLLVCTCTFLECTRMYSYVTGMYSCSDFVTLSKPLQINIDFKTHLNKKT